MNFLLITLFFLIWRGFDFFVIIISQKIIPYLGFFPYRDQLFGFNLPSWVFSLANFDGLHYIAIARNGYSQYEQAFFPLYPMLIKFLSPLFFNNQLLTGLIISNMSFLFGLFIFFKYLRLFSGNSNNFKPFTIILFLLAFPTSFFFGSVYTEGLFFLFLVSSLYFLKKDLLTNKYESLYLSAIFAFLASLTRLIGVFLIIPIVFNLLSRYKKIHPRQSYKKFLYFILNIKYLILAVSPIIGLGIYCFYLFKTTGDPLFFLTSQPIFGANRSSHLILLPQVYWRYLKIFFTAAHDPRFYVAIIEFIFFSFVLIILILDLIKNWRSKIKNWERISLNIFSFCNLILPTLTGTFSSIPRYSLFSLSLFIYISNIKNNFYKYLILLVFLLLHVLLLGYFVQGYFIS